MPNNVICPNCGTVNSSDSKQCQSCQAPIESKHHRFNSKDPRFWLILFVALFVSYLVGSYAISLFKEHEGVKDPIAQVVAVNQLTDWHTQQFPSGISIELPLHLKEDNLTLDPSLNDFIEKKVAYSYMKKNLAITLAGITYKPQVGTLSMEGALQGATGEIQAMTGTPVHVENKDIFEKDGLTYGMQTANYTDKANEEYQIKQTFVINGLTIWTFVVSYDSNDKRMKDIANKIYNSFKIKGVQ